MGFHPLLRDGAAAVSACVQVESDKIIGQHLAKSANNGQKWLKNGQQNKSNRSPSSAKDTGSPNLEIIRATERANFMPCTSGLQSRGPVRPMLFFFYRSSKRHHKKAPQKGTTKGFNCSMFLLFAFWILFVFFTQIVCQLYPIMIWVFLRHQSLCWITCRKRQAAARGVLYRLCKPEQ